MKLLFIKGNNKLTGKRNLILFLMLLNLYFGENNVFASQKNTIYCVKSLHYISPETSDQLNLVSVAWEIDGTDYYMNKGIAFYPDNSIESYALFFSSRDKLFWISIDYENERVGSHPDSIYHRLEKPAQYSNGIAVNVQSRQAPDPFYLSLKYYPSFSLEYSRLDTVKGLHYLFELRFNTGDDCARIQISKIGSGESLLSEVDPLLGQKYYEWMHHDTQKIDSLTIPEIPAKEYENSNFVNEDFANKKWVISGAKQEFMAHGYWTDDQNILKNFRKHFTLVRKNRKTGFRRYVEIDEPREKLYWDVYLR